jgi:outer membrane receptor protein involved in Fe transport
LILGVDASLGRMNTAYYGVAVGPVQAYEGASGERGALDTKGTGQRDALAAFVQYDVHPVPRVRLSVGSRFDAIWDAYEPDVPSDGERLSASHSAFSPKAGINVAYVRSARHVGNWYANVSQSFKTATLDQLYDQRTIPVDPAFSITISNPDLEPQHGTSIETGVYHRADVAPGRLAGELSLSVYQMDMTNELDFSIETFRFVNIGKSRHRGVEAGLKVYLQDHTRAFFNYTLQSVTSRYGAYEGNYVKAIPRDYISAGVHTSPVSGLGVAATVNAARRMYLDDANTVTLPDYTTVDARLSYQFPLVTLALEAFNLLDETYSTTGFPDPGGSDAVFFYPAAGRTLRLGVSISL